MFRAAGESLKPETLPPPGRERGFLFAALAPLLILALFAAGYAIFIGWPRWPVVDAGERIAYGAVAAAAIAIVVTLVKRESIRVPLDVIATSLCVLPAMWPQYQNEVWSAGKFSIAATIAVASVVIAAWLTRALRAREGQSPLASLVTLGMTGAAGALLMSTGSLKLGQAGFSLAAGVAWVFVVGLFVRSIGRSAGVTTMAMATLGGLLASGYLWSELPWWAAASVLIAPALAWIVRVPILARRPAWQRVVIGLFVAAIPAAIATTVAALEAQKASAAMEEFGY